MTDRITFGSLFAGIGGFDLGLEACGMRGKWQVEIDDYANRVLEKRWPDVTRHRDVRECGKHNLPWVDVVCGGFPCQDISSSGPRVGIHGHKSGLFFELMRIVRELRPRAVLLENVSDLLYRGLDVVLGELADSGFDSCWESIPAAWFGLPQPRWRVFIVAYPSGSGWQSRDQWISSRQEAIRRIDGNGLGEAKWRTKDGASFLSRVDDGIPARAHRLRCLGNAVPPAMVEFMGNRIKAVIGEGE